MEFYTEAERLSAVSNSDKEKLLSLLLNLSSKYKLTASELVKYAVKEANYVDKNAKKTSNNVEQGKQKNAGKKWTSDNIKELKKLCRDKKDIDSISVELARSQVAIILAIKNYILLPQELDPRTDMDTILEKYPMLNDDDDYQRVLLK